MYDKKIRLKYGIQEQPPLLITIGLGLQYVMLSVSGLLFPVILLSKTCSLNLRQTEYLFFATIIVSAVSTLLQIRRFRNLGSGYLMILGPSGTFIGSSISAVQLGGLPLMATMTLLSAPFEWLMARSLRHIRKLLTPALAGTVIMTIPILIIPLVMPMWAESDPLSPTMMPNFLAGLAAFAVVLIANMQSRAMLKLWAPAISIAGGLIISIFYGLPNWQNMQSAAWFSLPPNAWPGLELNLGWQHVPLFITFILATISSGIETFGDTIALQKVSEGKLEHIDYKRIQGGLNIDTLGSAMAGTMGTFANTTYSDIMPIIQLTRVASRVVGYAAGLIFIVLAFMPKFMHFFLAVPDAVMGGLTIALLLILFIEGFKVAIFRGVNTESGMIIGSGLIFAFIAASNQFFPALFPQSFEPITGNAITVGSIVALGLNIYFVYRPRKSDDFRASADGQHISKLQKHIESLKEPLSFTEKEIFALQLTAEEIFLHFQEELKVDDLIHYRWKPETDSIFVEISHTAPGRYLSIPENFPKSAHLDSETLSQLGLRLLSRTARNIIHSKISGYNYLEYEIPRERDAE